MPSGVYQHKHRSEKIKQQIREKLIGRKRPPRSEQWGRKIGEGHRGIKGDRVGQ
jgi:hypothetical protein